MNLNLYTWNNTAINDGTVLRSSFPRGTKTNLTANPVTVNRAGDFPFLSGTVLAPHTLVIDVDILPGQDLNAKRELIKQYFDITDQTRHNLVARDAADSNREWYVTGYPVRITEQNSPVVFSVVFALEYPYWRLVTTGTNTWNITASGQTNAVTNIGNMKVKPSFAITPTSAKTGGLSYRRWIPIYNNMDKAFSFPFEITGGGLDTSALVTFSSISNQINQGGGITNSATSWPIDTSVGGGLPTTGGMFIMGSEQCSYTGISAGTISGVVRGIGGTTAVTHADNTVMTLSKVKADGSDLRVWIDGIEADRWLNGMNGATTKIWSNLNQGPRHEGTTLGTVASGSTPVTITFTRTRSNLAFLQFLKRAANRVLLIDSEAFVYTAANIDLFNYQITSVVRNAKGTSGATHTAPKTVRHIEHDIWILYGDSTLSAPETDDDNKPIFDLSSTNGSLVFTNFYDNTANRPGAWLGETLASKTGLSYVFTAPDPETTANPSTELGLAMIGAQSVAQPMSETATLDWLFSHSSGITNVAYTGDKYATGSGWPGVIGLQYLIPNVAWVTAQNEDDPPTIFSSWEALSSYNIALGATYETIRFVADGSLSAVAGVRAMARFDTVTLTISSGNLPTVAVGSEIAAYFFDFILANSTSSESIRCSVPIGLNETLTIDCENKNIYLSDGGRAIITWSSEREDWLNLNVGSNTLSFTDAGTNAVTIVTTHRDQTI